MQIGHDDGLLGEAMSVGRVVMVSWLAFGIMRVCSRIVDRLRGTLFMRLGLLVCMIHRLSDWFEAVDRVSDETARSSRGYRRVPDVLNAMEDGVRT